MVTISVYNSLILFSQMKGVPFEMAVYYLYINSCILICMSTCQHFSLLVPIISAFDLFRPCLFTPIIVFPHSKLASLDINVIIVFSLFSDINTDHVDQFYLKKIDINKFRIDVSQL